MEHVVFRPPMLPWYSYAATDVIPRQDRVPRPPRHPLIRDAIYLSFPHATIDVFRRHGALLVRQDTA